MVVGRGRLGGGSEWVGGIENAKCWALILGAGKALYGCDILRAQLTNMK